MKYPTCKSSKKTEIVAWARTFKKRFDFPLTVLPSGYWVKKIDGRQVTFGPLSDPNAAIDAYRSYMTGDVGNEDGLTLHDGLNAFLEAMRVRYESGDLAYCTWSDYRRASQIVLQLFGRERRVLSLVPSDFARLRAEFAKKRRGKGLTNIVNDTRTIFKWLFENHLIDRPVRYGTEFRGPAKRELRRIAESKPSKMLDASIIRRLLDPESIASHFYRNRQCWQAMQFLGVNCGFTGVDVSEMTFRSLDLDNALHTLTRPKTMERRRAVLWPETVEAIRDYLAVRPTPKHGLETRVFLNSIGSMWTRPDQDNQARRNMISRQYSEYLRHMECWQRGVSFGALRHVFATIARETGMFDAVEYALGHVPTGVTAEYYVERVSDDALRRVAEHVRAWLFG